MSGQANPVVLITAGALRIGAVITNQLHRAGYNVVIHHRSAMAAAQELVAQLNQQRSNSAARVQADFTTNTDFTFFINQVRQFWGRVDAVVNNASCFYATALSTTTTRQWDDLMNANLRTPYFLAQAVAADLRRCHGSIINIGDVHGVKPLKGHAVYSTAKAGLLMLTQALAKDLAPAIRVNAVLPGMTLPPQQQPLSPTQQHRLLERTALKRLVDPCDVAQAVLCLLQNKSVTGELFTVDCGRSLNL